MSSIYIKLLFCGWIFIFFSCGREENPAPVQNLFLDEVLIDLPPEPLEYNGISENYRETVFLENFDDNTNNWKVGTTHDYTLRISQGVYYAESRENGKYWGDAIGVQSWHTTPHFEIEMRIRILKGTSNNIIVWGSDPNDLSAGYYFFLFESNRSYSIGKFANGASFSVRNKTASNFSPSDFNIFTIRKIGVNYYYFLNGIRVFQGQAESLFGSAVGAFASKGSAIEVDYVKVDRIRL